MDGTVVEPTRATRLCPNAFRKLRLLVDTLSLIQPVDVAVGYRQGSTKFSLFSLR